MAIVAVVGMTPSAARAAGAQSYFSALTTGGSSQLQTARSAAIAAPLLDGRVLIAGGQNGGGALQSAETFSPAGDTFTALPASGQTELQVPRFHAAAATLPDGEVLIAGGQNSGGTLRSAELFDPSANTFTALAASGASELTVARTGASAVTLRDGRVLIAGGYDGSAFLTSAEIYDPGSRTFTTLPGAHLNVAREGAAAALLPDGRVLVAGGLNGSSYLQSAELFDPADDTFTSLAASGDSELHGRRFFATASPLPDGHVLIAGGSTDGTNQLATAEIYDAAGRTFTALPATGSSRMSVGRASPVSAPLANGQVLIAGGSDPSTYLQSAELFSAAPEAIMAGGAFGDQTIGQTSAAETLTVTNAGAQALRLAPAALGPPGDFAIVEDGCAGRALAPRQSCTIDVDFTPSAAGARTATLQLDDNEPTPATLGLSGAGVTPNVGAAGAQGSQGATGTAGSNGAAGPAGVAGVSGPAGTTGATGPRGPAGKVELITCTTVTVASRLHGRRHTTKRRRCTTKVLAAGVSFTTTASARATLTRHGVVYASGVLRDGHARLRARRTVRQGRYTLTLVSTARGRRQTSRIAVDVAA